MKIYKKHIINNFIKLLFIIISIFFLLVLLLNLLEELNFFKNSNESLYYPVLLNFLNAPSILINIFPFIFLISTQFLFINLIEKNELIILKNFGIDNLRLIGIISFVSFVASLIIIIFFYSFSAKLKHLYLDIKNDFASDNKYLAVITENGIWIKDAKDGITSIINAEDLKGNILNNVDIVQFNEDFNFIQNISADKINIENKIWKSNSVLLNNEQESNRRVNDFQLSTNINFQDINSLFSNLTSLSIFELNDLRNKYNDINYSSTEVDSALQKIFSFPFYLMLMTILSSTIMMNIKQNRTKIFHLIFGILISVIIYYLSFFFEELGKNEQVPVLVSIWIPLLMIGIVSMINLVRINEK